MSALVIKSWKASETPTGEDGVYISIQARRSGLVSLLCSLCGMDAVTSLKVTGERIEWKESSLAGWRTVLLPLEKVNHIYHGYYNPWKKALLIFFLVFLLLQAPLNLIAPILGSIVSFPVALVAGLVYFFLTRSFELGIVAGSRSVFTLPFKRSMVGTQEINAKEAEFVTDMLDYLCDCRRHMKAS